MDINSVQLLFLFFGFILSCYLLFSITRSKGRSLQTATPPGPPRLPIIGNIHQIGKNPHQSLAHLSKTYGQIMSLKLGRLNVVVISSPEAAGEVLRTHDQILSSRSPNEAILAIAHPQVSVVWLPPSSARWRLLRKLMATQLFSPHRIEFTKDLRMKKVNEFMKFMSQCSEKGEAVDISRVAFITVLNIVSNIMFSLDLGSYDSRKSNEFQDNVIDVMESVGKPDVANFFPFLGFLDLQGNIKNMKVSTDRLVKVFRGFIDAKIAEKSLRDNPRDFVDALVDEPELNSNDIEHLLLDLYTAGTDTSSITVGWAMTELLRNPKAMVKAQAEIEHVIGHKDVFEESDVSELMYLQAVVKETLRLHPPVPLLVPRKAESDIEVLGYLVPKDTQVLVNVWAIGRDPNVWENPTRFEPERFLGEELIDVKGRDYEFTPFGAGRRICPGMSLAMKMVHLMLGSLLFSFDWKLPNGVVYTDLEMDETFGLALRKTNPLHAVPIKKRNIN